MCRAANTISFSHLLIAAPRLVVSAASMIARYGLNPIMIVLNNDGYGPERSILDGTFNDIQTWQYRNIT